jgi:hypothetical protein
LRECYRAITGAGYPFTDIRGSSFFTACICAADVPFSAPRMWPSAEIGLMTGMTRGSYPASNRWMNILAGGDFDPNLVVEPSPLRHAPLPPPVNLTPGLGWRSEL